MTTLFHYDELFVSNLKTSGVIEPPNPPDSLACQRQPLLLQETGFTCLWRVEHARLMHRFGALQARTYTDGANWPFQRAQWIEDGLARWGLVTDVEYFDQLLRALGIDPKRTADIAVSYEGAVLSKLAERVQLNQEQLAAIEAVVRLSNGRTDVVLSFLEAL